MSPRRFFHRTVSRLRRDDEGSALVEFGLILPVCLLFFGVAIEGARTFWAYQTVISGVRDAARFVGRAAPNNICTNGGSLSGYSNTITQIVRDTREGNTLFPASIRVDSVTANLNCVAAGLRVPQTPVATVTATLSIDYPFKDVFALIGATLPDVTTTVTDSSRIFGA